MLKIGLQTYFLVVPVDDRGRRWTIQAENQVFDTNSPRRTVPKAADDYAARSAFWICGSLLFGKVWKMCSTNNSNTLNLIVGFQDWPT